MQQLPNGIVVVTVCVPAEKIASFHDVPMVK